MTTQAQVMNDNVGTIIIYHICSHTIIYIFVFIDTIVFVFVF